MAIVARNEHRAMTVGQLVARFTTAGDNGAFAELVARYERGVLRRCRRVLWNEQDAEDACQATFSLLCRRAATLREPELLGGWLRGAAGRIAERVRRRAARRSRLECQAERPAEGRPPEDSAGEVARIVREEVGRLPASYREVVTLCHLEGATQREAASRLGWPLGTVKVRLVRARRLLRERPACRESLNG